MIAVRRGLEWIFLLVVGTSIAVPWLYGIEPGTAVWWALAILITGEAAFVSGNIRTRLWVGALVTMALSGVLADTPGLLTPPGRTVVYLIASVVIIHLGMSMAGLGKAKAQT